MERISYSTGCGWRIRSITRGTLGALAQLVERLVRNEKVSGSNPLCSTLFVLGGLDEGGEVVEETESFAMGGRYMGMGMGWYAALFL